MGATSFPGLFFGGVARLSKNRGDHSYCFLSSFVSADESERESEKRMRRGITMDHHRWGSDAPEIISSEHLLSK